MAVVVLPLRVMLSSLPCRGRLCLHPLLLLLLVLPLVLLLVLLVLLLLLLLVLLLVLLLLLLLDLLLVLLLLLLLLRRLPLCQVLLSHRPPILKRRCARPLVCMNRSFPLPPPPLPLLYLLPLLFPKMLLLVLLRLHLWKRLHLQPGIHPQWRRLLYHACQRLGHRMGRVQLSHLL